MADPLFDISVIFEFFGYSSGPQVNMIGGLPGNDAGYANQYSVGEHYIYDQPFGDNCTYDGGGWITTSNSGHSSLQIGTVYIGGSYDTWRWNWSAMYPGDHGTFTLEMFLNVIGGDGLFYDNAYWDANLGMAAMLPRDLTDQYNGIWMKREAGELVVYTGYGATSTPIRYPTGLMMSGAQHFLIQYQERDMHFIVGLDGDTYKVPVPWTCNYDEHAIGGSKWSWNNPMPVSPEGTQCSVRSVRVTTKRLRYGELDTGSETYAVPAQGYVGQTTLPSNPPRCELQMPTDIYGETRFDYDRTFPDTDEPVYRCVNVTGGTPPYTYQWVDYMASCGDLGWAIYEQGTPQAKFKKGALSETHVYWPVCIVTDANGLVCTTTPTTGVPYADDGKWQGPLNIFVDSTWNWSNTRVVTATVGDTAYLESNSIMHCFSRKAWKTAYAPRETTFTVNGAGSANGTSVLLAPSTYVSLGGPPDYIAVDAPDAYKISPVTIEDQGVSISATWYKATGEVRGTGTITLNVIDVPSQIGWWTNLFDTEQTGSLVTANALRPYTDAQADVVALRARADFADIQASVEEQLFLFEDPATRTAFTEYDVAYRAYYLVDYLPAYWLSYNGDAPRLNPWNLAGEKEFAYGQGVDLAFWSQSVYLGEKMTFLPETGTVFQEVFNAAYRGCWEGYSAGRYDKVNVNPEFTSRIPDAGYRGPYPDDYVSAYNDGYDLGFAP